MKLMTKEIARKLTARPIHSTDGKGFDAEVVVKYFNPTGAGTWLITEGEQQAAGDWLLYGYCYITTWEWGYVLLSQLEEIWLPMGLRIERDLHSCGTVKELAE